MKRALTLLLPLALLAGCTAPGVAPPSPQVSLPAENPAPGDHETAFLDTTGEVRHYLKWAKAAGCTGETVTTITMAGAPAHVRTSACAGGAEHIVYSLTDMGHEWPVDASRLIWEFFTKHPLP